MTATSGASVKDTNEETDILVKMARQVRRKEGLDQKKKKRSDRMISLPPSTFFLFFFFFHVISFSW